MLIQIFISLFLLAGMLPAQKGPDNDMGKITSSLPANTRFSISILDADKNHVILEKNSSTPLRPASNIKLYTTGSSLLYFGSDYMIKTSLYFNKGKIKGNELDGDIYIKGFGDALFKTANLDYLVNEIEKSGIKVIKGRIIYDNSFFKKKLYRKVVATSLSHLDVPSISPLSINNNIIEVFINDNGRGAKITSIPSSKYISLVNNISTLPGRKRPDAEFMEGSGGLKITINTLPVNSPAQKYFFFLKKPELLLSLLLMEKLENRGIMVLNQPAEGLVPAGNLVEISSSTHLTELIKDANKNSNNFLAEDLKYIFDKQFSTGAKLKQNETPGISLLAGSGINTIGLNITDGSGISPHDKATTRSLTGLLHLIYTRTDLYKIFKESLSIAGVDGTMKEKFSNSPVKSNFYGKTGFMAGVSSISGYMRTKLGTNIIVSILINYIQKGIEYYEGIEKEILELIYYKY